MATVLIVEQNPDLRQLVRSALPEGWSAIEAPDGLGGLDCARRQLRQIRLVVLGLDLPDMDGTMVCLRLRERAPELPILPIGDSTASIGLLDELGCLPVLLRPLLFSELQRELRWAIQQPPRPVALSAALVWAYEQSRLIEQAARRRRRALRVAIFASSQVKRAGLARMLGDTAELAEAATPAALQLLLAGARFTALVTDAADQRAALPLASSYGLPVILIAATLEQSRSLHTPSVATVIVESDRAAAVRLALALEAIASGAPERAHQIDLTAAAQPGRTIPPRLAQLLAETPLSPREQEVLWLDSQGLSSPQIAHYLSISAQTVGSHWKGAQRKMQMRRMVLRAWLQLLAERA